MRKYRLCALSLCTLSLLQFSNLALAETVAQNRMGPEHKSAHTGLPAVLKHVYDNSPALNAAREKFYETEELYPQARAGWLPKLNAEGGIYATDIESSNFSNGDGATTKDMTLSVDQPLWRGGTTTARIDRAHELISSGRHDLRQAEQEILLRAATVYMDTLRDREILDLSRQNEEILNRELGAAQERKNIGDLTDTDVQQARSRLARARSERLGAESNYAASVAAFEEITGLPVPEKLTFAYNDFTFPQTLEEMIAMAGENNPEIWSARHEQKAAEHQTDAVFGELLPQVSAYASLNKQYDPQPGIVAESRTETIGLRAVVPLYEGGAVRSRVREAERAAKRRQFNITETSRRIRQEVTSNWRAWQSARSETQSRKDQIAAAQGALAGVREEAKAGQRTLLDVLDADQELIDAKAALARARRNESVANFTLAASLGMFAPQNVNPDIDVAEK